MPRLRFNAFSMNCVSHIHHGQWVRPEGRSMDYTDLDAWIELAQILDRGKFDALFLADVVGTYAAYGGNRDAAVEEGLQTPVNDPSLLIPAMALATENLGFAFTQSVLQEQPFNFARRLSTLDHLTKGRVGWNIVTSYLPDAARNLGFGGLPSHEDRYRRAEEYMQVVYKLLEGSWEDDAVIRDVGPGVSVAPGASAQTTARLWVGPKLVKQIQAEHVPGLERAVDFSSYAWLAWIAELLFAVLAFVHGLVGNWGWAIIGLVVIVKALMFPLSAAQYKSMAKMRRFQPRIEQLKERYGDDKQKLQMAMMELYKKEKINPVGGCLPLLVQMPIFLALYYTLLESVELRQAPWIGWIHNLTAPDPYFILPVINIAVTWATQKLSPATIADQMQRKMMQIMPVAMGVMFAFFPAGTVLYWVTNGSLGLLQQWWMTRKYGGTAKPA